jgi:AmmeMemoRadiSam system protein B
MFYNLDPRHLDMQVRELFSGVKTGKSYKMVISPHAGYVYSGKTAAHAVGSLGQNRNFIILGPNHTGLGPPFSVMSSGSWATPLGSCKIDPGLADQLKGCGFLTEDEAAHSQEHSIEVQLPLLQHRFKDFGFAPVCITNLGYTHDFLKECDALGRTVAGILKAGNSGVSVIASSDFSHYLPLEVANMKDGAALDRILHLDVPGFFQTLGEEDASICGFGPIAVVMAAARELGLKPELIHKSSSGDETRDFGSVVTYYAIGFG